jgi:2-dehydro-3-deoxyphosphooctonate aldolase (KDO 8-P synthase)
MVVTVGPARIGDGDLALIAGPCVIEDEDTAFTVARALAAYAARVGQAFVFKASFDKANRSAGASFRGLGMDEGLRVLAAVRAELGVPVTTDVHDEAQVDRVAEVVDLLQVPAFLCRQTDLLRACARSGRPVNVKKGQFLAPDDARHIVDKLQDAAGVLLTERGTSFGHHDLVVDYRGLVTMRELGVPVVFDATHSVQRPGAGGDRSSGDRRYVRALGRAAVAVGVDAVFAEIHPEPARALSDADTQIALAEAPELLESWLRLHRAAR